MLWCQVSIMLQNPPIIFSFFIIFILKLSGTKTVMVAVGWRIAVLQPFPFPFFFYLLIYLWVKIIDGKWLLYS